MRKFVKIDYDTASSPYETTICTFRHLIEENGIGKKIFAFVNVHLKAQGNITRNGTIVDATIIPAPSSTKNDKKNRNPGTHQTKEGNQWYFGLKGRIGVDRQEKMIHSVDVTPAYVHDSQIVAGALPGGERKVWGTALSGSEKGQSRRRIPTPET